MYEQIWLDNAGVYEITSNRQQAKKQYRTLADDERTYGCQTRRMIHAHRIRLGNS